jgi:hypothetical protein
VAVLSVAARRGVVVCIFKFPVFVLVGLNVRFVVDCMVLEVVLLRFSVPPVIATLPPNDPVPVFVRFPLFCIPVVVVKPETVILLLKVVLPEILLVDVPVISIFPDRSSLPDDVMFDVVHAKKQTSPVAPLPLSVRVLDPVALSCGLVSESVM